MTEPPQVVGRSVQRLDGPAKVTGAATFAIDISLPGMAHAHVVRSERAHARILAIATSEAADSPGVLTVITASELSGLFPYFGHIAADHPILAQGRTLYYGEPVAVVVAETREQASAAAEEVRVHYDDLVPVIDSLDALADDAPMLHAERAAGDAGEGFDADTQGLEGNLCARSELGWGDVEEGFAEAAMVVEGTYRYPMLYGYAMEPYNAVANFVEGELVVYSTAQHPFMVRDDLARIFDLPLARVRVVVPYVGGGYGTKSYTKVEPLAAVSSWATGRPVRLALSVEESILTTRSDSAIVRARSGFTSEGRLTAREFDIVLNSGAFSDNSPVVCAKVANRCFGPYRIPALKVRVRSVFTNTVPASSLRGFGAPQGAFAGEHQMDEAAGRLGMDAVELRMRNLVGPGEELIPGKRPLDADLRADLEMLARSLGWPVAEEGRGIGLAVTASDAGAFPVSTAIVRIHADGSASAMTGATELGQGSRTISAQIVAEELGLPIEQVSVVASDTSVTPYERTTGASRTTTLTGRALVEACRDVRTRIREAAAHTFGVAPNGVVDRPGGVEVGGGCVSYAEVLRGWFRSGGEFVGFGAIRPDGDLASLPPFWEIGAAGVVVSLDRETGEVHVERLATVGDVGQAINPALVHGQDLGAAMMGLGAALHEELIYEGESLINPNVVDYRLPRFRDLPGSIDLMLAERHDGTGPYGAKGVGEGAFNPMAAAVASALGRAAGVSPHQVPMTPERVWRLIREGGTDDGG